MENGKFVDLGVQSFEMLRERNSFYIDKTGFIKEWWERGVQVTLITRPRRFGKTLNMNMLNCFFSPQYADRKDLFEGLSIWEEEKYRQMQGTHPVIFLSFASVKSGEIEGIKQMVKWIIADVYWQFADIIKSERFSEEERREFSQIKREMDDITAVYAINRLCRFLEKYYGKKVIVLLDEYDTPMQEAWLAGNWDDTVSFFRLFFNATFKTNFSLFRAVITGITRISKESMFSDLNNLKVATITSDDYALYFGFTETEVFAALDTMGLGEHKKSVKAWYDGFCIGTHTDIYNPWSVAAFIDSKGKLGSYWVNTSTNGLINTLMQRGSADMKQALEDLVGGKSIRVQIDEQIVFNQIDKDEGAVWSLFLASGYLTATKVEPIFEEQEELPYYTLTLTNREVLVMMRQMVRGWFDKGSTKAYYNEFINALLNDNVRKMNTFMNKVALNTFSFFDAGKQPSETTEPERFYHGFVLGMVVNLADRYRVRSNRESGYGRYDVMLEPMDKTEKAFIFEFKVLDPDEDESTLEETVANAHRQIEEKKYEAELAQAGIAPERIRKYGFAFEGKKCLIG